MSEPSRGQCAAIGAGPTTDPTTLLIVADLHLAAGPHDPFDGDREFASFLTHLLGHRTAPRLIILGDLFDFILTRDPTAGEPVPLADTSSAGAQRRLQAIAEAHHIVIGALAEFTAQGGTIDLVAGNHDVELLRPEVQGQLRALLDEPPPDRLRIHPWIVHLPGVLYAEHGHQHHDVNAFATLLDPCRDGQELDLPLGSQLAHLEAHASVGARAHTVALAATLAWRAISPAERARVRRYRGRRLPQEARTIGLDAATLVALDTVTPRDPAAMLARLGRRAVGIGRAPGSTSRTAAVRIHRLLEARGREVALYAFGHTHVAERRPIVPGQETPLYLNPGTWSKLRREADTRRRPYVEIELGEGLPTARLLSWEGGRRPRPRLRATARSPRQPVAGRSETGP